MKIKNLKMVCFGFFICLFSIGCSGKLTVNVPNKQNKVIRKVFIEERETSHRVPVNLALLPVGILGGAVGGAIVGFASQDMKEYEIPAIGNTYLHIKNFFEKSGYTVISGNPTTIPPGIDAIIDYYDFWEWDLKDYLKILKITFKNPETGNIFAEGLYRASDEAGMHDYPSSEREAPNVLSAILAKLAK